MSKPKYIVRNITDLKDMLEQAVALYGDKDAFIKRAKDIDIGITYKKYKEDVSSLGTGFINMGIKGERVVILSENRYEWCLTFMATVCSNGVIVPISIDLSDEEIVSRINSVKAKFIVFSERCRDIVKSFRKKCPTLKVAIDMDTIINETNNLSFLRLLELGNKEVQSGNNSFTKLKIESEDGACVFWGDTILKNKPVLLSHKNVVTNIMSIISFLPIESQESTIVLEPLDKVYICIYNFLIFIAQGGIISFSEKNKKINEVCIETSPSILILSKDLFYNMYRIIWASLGNMPEIRKTRILMILSNILLKLNIDKRQKIFKNILKEFGKKLKLIVIVGENIKNSILRDFYSLGLNTVECYQIIEASSIAMINDKNDFINDKIVGLPVPNLKANILLNTNGKSTGEIILQGDSIMLGYYDDIKSTSKVLKGNVLYTGKFGNRDKNGYFYLAKNKENRK